MLLNKVNKSSINKYPFDCDQIQSLDPNKKQFINKLLYLFVFYASKGSKHAFKDLQEKNFIEMMSELWAAGGKQVTKYSRIWNDLTMLFYSKGSKKMLEFPQFLQLLPTLSYYFQPELKKDNSMKSLLHHLNVVYEKIVLPEIDGKVINGRLEIEEKTREFVLKLKEDLGTVYKFYFPHENCNKFRSNQTKFRTSSLEQFFQVMKDFQVFPKFISARDLFYIFQDICLSLPSSLLLQQQNQNNLKQIGEYFTFSKFIESLFTTSRRIYSKLKRVENEEDEQEETKQKEKLRTLLEYMQTVKVTKKRNKPKLFSELRFSFIVLDEHPQEEEVKKITVRDKLVKETASDMNFYLIMEKLKL